jgi:D-alanyl-D-alanine carboxypeptidase (penicillin-binding protein 5/6)
VSRRLAVRAAVAVCLAVGWAAFWGAFSLSAHAAQPSLRARAQPNLSAHAAILVEPSTGTEMYGLAADQELPIASTTKLMTALLTLEHVDDLATRFTQNDYRPAAVDSQIGLAPGERMSVHDLLIAMLVPSADDAAEDLAFNVGGGSVARFVGMMNVRAQQLGLTHTHYSTPSGLDTPGNYSSASDLVKLAGLLLAHHPFFAQVVALPRAVLHTGNHPRLVANRNDLVGLVPWVNGVKTGHTLGAGYVLVGSGTRDGMTLLSAVLGTPTPSARDSDTLALLDYGFTHFRLATAVLAGALLAKTTVKYRSGVHAELIAAGTFTRVVARDAVLTTRIQAPRQLEGPLRRHAVVGQVTVLADGRPIARIPLLLASALSAVSPITIATQFLTRASTLLLLAVLLAAVVGLTVLRRERARGREAAGLQEA